MYDVIQIERGWQGHFMCTCNFHLNTLLHRKIDNYKIIISTVGNCIYEGEIMTIGNNRYYETMVFESTYDDYDDADVLKQITFDSNWCYPEKDDLLPQNGHWVVVDELKQKLQNINLFPLRTEISFLTLR